MVQEATTKVRTLEQLLERYFGVKTRAVENPVATSIGTTATEILKNNPSRVAAIIVNLSTNNIFVSLENDVSSSKGVFLSPSGGFLIVKWDEDFQTTAWARWAVASGASSAIYTVEVVLY